MLHKGIDTLSLYVFMDYIALPGIMRSTRPYINAPSTAPHKVTVNPATKNWVTYIMTAARINPVIPLPKGVAFTLRSLAAR